MVFDLTRFPLVFLREQSETSSQPDAQAQFQALLDKGQVFVFLTDHLPGAEHQHEESHEERKQRALFFKQNRQRLKALCAGMVVITLGRPVPLSARLAEQALNKMLGLQLAYAQDEQQAEQVAWQLLQA